MMVPGSRSRRRPRGRLRACVTVLALGAGVVGAQAAAGPAAAPGTYRVTRGETLSEVAVRLRVSVAALARANRIPDIHRIRAGTRLVVPRSAPGASRRDTARLPLALRRQPARMALLPRFDAEARRYGVPADLFKALTWVESGWQNHKMSSTNALGIGQLMPDTVAFVNERLLHADLDPRRPEHNIRMSARFLAYLLQRSGGDVPAAVGSYYQGLASVRRIGPLPETQRYVATVLAMRKKF